MDLARLGFIVDSGPLSSATSAAKMLAGALAAIGVGFSLDKTLATVTAFEDSLLRLQATSRATTEDMAKLEKQARSLGATSRYSAQQAAQAQNFLAMAGFKTGQIMQATGDVIKFASAASVDLAQSADIASNVLGQMQLPVSQLSSVMDTLINTSQSSNTNVVQLADALGYVGPIATAAGIKIEELSGAIGVLGDAGIQGGRAGTGLTGMIRGLLNATPAATAALAKYGLTTKDVDVTTLGLVDVLLKLKDANISAGDSMVIFGSESASAALNLAAGADRVKELTAANKAAAGSTSDVATLLDSGLSAAMASVGSAAEEMMLQMGDNGLGSSMKTLLITTAGVINAFNGMLPEFAKANGLSEEFEGNIKLLADTIYFAGTALIAYGGYLAIMKAATIAGAAANAIYAASLNLISTGAITASASLKTLSTWVSGLAALFVGWQIGTYLREEFEIVEKAGIALMSGLHQAGVFIAGVFEIIGANIKFALTNPLDAARGAVVDYLEFVSGLGIDAAELLGFDASKLKATLAKGYGELRGSAATEHAAKIATIKANIKEELQTVSDGYYEQFAAVGRIAKNAAKDTDELLVVNDKLNETLGELGDNTGKLSDAQKALKSAFEDTLAQYHRMINLSTDATESEKLLYEIQYGRLIGLAPAQQKMLDGLAKEIDAKNALLKAEQAQEEINNRSLEIVKALRTDEEARTDTLREQLDIIRQSTVLTAAQKSQSETRAAVAAIDGEVPQSTFGDNSGGAMQRYAAEEEALNSWYSKQMDMLTTFRTEFADQQATWDLADLAAKQHYAQQMLIIDAGRQDAMLATSEVMFSSAAAMAKQFAGESSGIYKAMFIAEKAAGMARALVAINTGIAMAAANPWPANLGAIASVAAATAGMVGNIAAVGMAHDGIDSVPQEGTWLLDKGERVTTSETSAKLDRTLDAVVAQLSAPQQQGQKPVSIVNVLDPSLVGDYLSTDSGEDLVMNIVQRNRSSLGG